jgi:hypothetical protein
MDDRLRRCARLEADEQNEQPRADDRRTTLVALADDLPGPWNHPAASETWRIFYACPQEVVSRLRAHRRLVLHWQGRNPRGEVAKTIWKIAGRLASKRRNWSANSLAYCGPRYPASPTGSENARQRTELDPRLRVRGFPAHQISIYHDGERTQRQELILHEAASRLGVHKMTVVRDQDGLCP